MAFGQGSVSIDTAKVISTASTINSISSKIQGQFDEAKTAVKNVDSAWDSPAGEQLVATFEKTSADFPEFVNAVKKFSEFLDQTAQAYEQLDTSISDGASM